MRIGRIGLAIIALALAGSSLSAQEEWKNPFKSVSPVGSPLRVGVSDRIRWVSPSEGLETGSQLRVDALVRSDSQTDIGISSSLHAGKKWDTNIYGGFLGNFADLDYNDDGYMDEPRNLRFNLANSWEYRGERGLRLSFGVGAVYESSKGGQSGYDYKDYAAMVRGESPSTWLPWGSDISHSVFDGFLRLAFPLGGKGSQRMDINADYSYRNFDSRFGSTKYSDAINSTYFLVQYVNQFNGRHKLAVGLDASYDRHDESIYRLLSDLTVQGEGIPPITDLVTPRVFGEYTFTAADKVTAFVRLSLDWYNGTDDSKWKFVPSVGLKYTPDEHIMINLHAGRELRYANPLTDNIGVFFTGKLFVGDYVGRVLEDAWTYGGSLKYYFPFGASDNTYFFFDYSGIRYAQQLVVDYEYLYAGATAESGGNATGIAFYNLDGRRSFTDKYFFEFNVEAFRGFTVNASFRYINSKIQYLNSKYPLEWPLANRSKGTLLLQYATKEEKWVFDLSASVFGRSRVYEFMEYNEDADGNLLYKNGMTPVYPQLDFKVTKRFKKVDVFIVGENLTNYRQKYVILGNSVGKDGYVNGNDLTFDGRAIWGPTMGIRVYAGVKFTL